MTQVSVKFQRIQSFCIKGLLNTLHWETATKTVWNHSLLTEDIAQKYVWWLNNMGNMNG